VTRLEAVIGDLTEQHVDVVVNAANSSLLGGGGVDGAIHRAGGPQILAECEQVRERAWRLGLPTGEAVSTGGGLLPATWVVHTVGPVYGECGGSEPALLASCHRRSLEVAVALGARTVAFPAISCGVYGYPAEEAAPIAVGAVRGYVAEHPDALDLVRFVLVDERLHPLFSSAVSAAR
jgi:O-acetyl-ADP-ribose deacetylase (regulator of RNase III)